MKHGKEPQESVIPPLGLLPPRDEERGPSNGCVPIGVEAFERFPPTVPSLLCV